MKTKDRTKRREKNLKEENEKRKERMTTGERRRKKRNERSGNVGRGRKGLGRSRGITL